VKVENVSVDLSIVTKSGDTARDRELPDGVVSSNSDSTGCAVTKTSWEISLMAVLATLISW